MGLSLSLMTTLAATPPLAAQQSANLTRFEPCGNAARVVECAQLTVRERPGDTTSRPLALRIVRIRRDSTVPAPTATFVLAGGPGTAAPNMARGDLTNYVAWAEHGDVVFMNQRGTEEGSPLRCEVGDDFDPFAGIFPIESLTRCREAGSKVLNFATHGTEDAADDIELARAALGYREINFVGVSYGSRLALEYMQRFPDRVRAAVLDGVVPREIRAPLYYVSDAEASLRHLSALCRADDTCRRFGDPFARFRSVMSRLTTQPAMPTVRVGPSSPERQVAFGPEDFAYVVRGILYGDGAMELPRLLAHADSTGDLTMFARQYAQRVVGIARNSSMGLHLSVFCAEDIATLTPRRIAQVAATTVAGAYLADQYVAACRRLAVPAGRTDTVTPLLTRPLLLLSGALDPVAPPRWGDTVRARSTSAQHVVFPYGGHTSPGAGMAACKAKLVGEFLRTARPDLLDTGCIKSAALPKFAPPS